MGEDIRLRAACDRCHTQKVRCPKKPEEESCDRCIKAKVSCKYSPFREKKPPRDDAVVEAITTNSLEPSPSEKPGTCGTVTDEARKRKRPRSERALANEHGK